MAVDDIRSPIEVFDKLQNGTIKKQESFEIILIIFPCLGVAIQFGTVKKVIIVYEIVIHPGAAAMLTIRPGLYDVAVYFNRRGPVKPNKF